MNLFLSVFLVTFGSLFLQSENQKMQKTAITEIPVIDGIVHRIDFENRFLYIALDREGRIIQEINIDTIESVYLIQGRPEKLKNYLIGGTIGGTAGLSSVLWSKIIAKNGENGNGGGTEKQVSLTELALRAIGGTGAGLLVAHLWKEGEKDARPFPVYDPSIKQKNPSSSIDFGDKTNLKTKLIEKKSFVHVTLRR